MKRVIFLLISLFFISSLFAFTDSYEFMNTNEYYLDFFAALKSNETDPIPFFEKYLESEKSVSAAVRAYCQMARYSSEHGEREAASSYYDGATDLFKSIPEEEYGIIRDIAESDIVSVEYMINGGVKRGLAASKKVKELYKKYPDDVSVALSEAYRYINTPPIAGGSDNKALKILNEIEKCDWIKKPDMFSLLIAKAAALLGKEEPEESEEYINRALEIYEHDTMIDSLVKKIEKSLKDEF